MASQPDLIGQVVVPNGLAGCADDVAQGKHAYDKSASVICY